MSTTNIWQGEKVRLRGVEPSDWEHFAAWNQDTEIARLCYHIPFPASTEHSKKFATESATQTGKEDIFRWMIETLEGVPVGSLNTFACDPRHGTFGYGLALSRDHWRKGYASEAIRIVLRYYFHELRYQKCNVTVYDFNPASIALHESLGFQHEGRLRRVHFTNGVYHDVLQLGITVEEFVAYRHNNGS